ADRNRSHWSTSKTPSYTKSVSWQHHLFSLPVMAFRILEMYFFLMLTIGVFIKQKKNYYFVFCKVLILLYLTYYYHMVFGVINV
ncbi:hypothetical protein RNO38_25265, partial [Escherichia coli]|nr:hypothetical protein [Escherichia coli]